MPDTSGPKSHLVILKKPYLRIILDGTKTIESRFTKNKPKIFRKVHPGDILFLKESAGPVRATATVKNVRWFENLDPRKISQLQSEYNDRIKGESKYWLGKTDARFGFLVWLNNVRQITPVNINKKDWRAWVLLTERENFGLPARLPSKPPVTGHKKQ